MVRLRLTALAFLGFFLSGLSAQKIYEVNSDTGMVKVPWLTLGAGDQVRIHWKAEPYHCKIGIKGRGTQDQPIRITGVPGGENGEQMPILSGENAVTDKQFQGFFNATWDESMALIMIKQADAQSKPGYIVIEKLKIIKTKLASAYTAMDGSIHHFGDNQHSGQAADDFSSAIMANPVEHLIVRECELTDNSLGLFVMSKGDEATTSRDILIERNIIYGNGVVDNYGEHNVYTEAAGIVIQYNYFGALRPNAIGSMLKDRSAGTVIRYNWFETSARTIDIVEAEEGYPLLSLEPEYHKTYIYGNIIVNNIGQTVYADNMIHYGYDNVPASARLGPHYFFNNTVVVTGSGSPSWGISIFQCGTDWGTTTTDNPITLDIRNNILYWNPATIQDGGVSGGMELLNTFGTARLEGVNWINNNWQHGHSGFKGTVTVNGTLLTGASPGFTNESGENFALTETSLAINQGAVLPESLALKYPVSSMYMPVADSAARTTVGSSIDLGALEYGFQINTPVTVVHSEGFLLHQNVPNPFNFTTTIGYTAPYSANVKLVIYDFLGRPVRALINGFISAGSGEVEWDGKDAQGQTMRSGIYFYQLQDDSGHSLTGKIIYLNK